MSFTVPFIGRLEQVYVKTEGQSTYGVSPTLASTDAVRHLDLDLTYNALARTNAMDKLSTPDQQRRISHRTAAGFDFKQIAMWPSGVLGTIPETDVLLTNGFGAKQAITPLSTTVTAGTTPSTTQMTLAAVTGLVANRSWVLINIASLGTNHPRLVTAIATNLITVSPALPTAPATSDTVKSGVDYYPATNPASAFTVASYIPQLAGSSSALYSREINGCVVDKMGFMFDGNNDAMMSFSGPGKTQTKPAQTQPGAFTVPATVPPPGILGNLRVGASAYPMLKAKIEVVNNMVVRNAEYGVSTASSFYRKGRRTVTVQIDAYVEDPTAIYDNAVTAAGLSVLIQAGTTAGSLWALLLPKVEFDVPNTPDGENELIWSFKGTALGVNGNDEIYLGQL
jgi:hypothetical protein